MYYRQDVTAVLQRYTNNIPYFPCRDSKQFDQSAPYDDAVPAKLNRIPYMDATPSRKRRDVYCRCQLHVGIYMRLATQQLLD